MNKIDRFMIIDDDPMNNMFCKHIIRDVMPAVETIDFLQPDKGLEYITSGYAAPDISCNTLLLLDINMPVMSGWEFLGLYDQLTDHIKKQFTVYILSSSVDPRDRSTALENKNIRGYLTKPLHASMLRNIIAEVMQ
jgi:CheY-like chemotaxis protein